jgi:excisionase family DNA binding protein
MAGLPTYHTPEELAEALRVNKRTVYAWLNSGRLQGDRVGKFWRVTDAQFEAFKRASAKGASEVEPAPVQAEEDPAQTNIYEVPRVGVPPSGAAGPAASAKGPVNSRQKKRRR